MSKPWRERRAAGWSSEDRPEDLREWRWRSYTDHLLDMGYDLAAGQSASDESSLRREAGRADSPGSQLVR